MRYTPPAKFIFIFVALVLLLGYLIYEQLDLKIFQEDVSRVDEAARDDFSLVTSEDRVLQWPLETAPDEEKQSHAELIRSLAQRTEVLFITKDCAISPVVLQVGFGESIVVQNQDSLPHTLSQQAAELNITIPAGQEQVIIAEFPAGPGNY